MKKKYLLSVMLLVLLVSQSLFANGITMTLNGKSIVSATAPIQEDGTTLVPLRVIGENLGAEVNYNKVEKIITISKGSTVINLELSNTSTSKGARLINGVAMVPIRFVSEELGANVAWESKTQTVAITMPEGQYPIATINIKNYGKIQAELYPQYAPNTVANFISLSNSSFYDGLTFHRVVKDFVLQGGCPKGDGTGGPGYSITGEFVANGYDVNRLAHVEGVLSMARANDPNSAGSQFFIMTGNADYLNGNYAAFGKVIKGLDIVKQLNEVNVDSNDKPLEPVIIESIRVDTYGTQYGEPQKIK